MESLDKLRELAADINSAEIIDHLDVEGKFVFRSEWLDSWHKAFDAACDEIESEIAERYMELPVDADGVPIRVGDELYNGEVIAFGGLAEGGVVFVHRGFMDGNYILEAFASNVTHHVKSRTVVDVLHDFWEEWESHSTDAEWDVRLERLRESEAKYAAEIRELLGVSE